MAINPHFQNELVQLAQTRLAQRPVDDPLLSEDIISTLERLVAAFPEWRDGVSIEAAAAQLNTIFSTFIGAPSVLEGRSSHKPWVNGRQDEIKWRYWERYRSHLVLRKMAQPAIISLDRLTDRILDLIGDPASDKPFNRRGMVVGDVQSGKTGNYTGLICKAADAGYKVIIVLAGLNNNLRSQTQIRLDEGFIGKITVPIGETASRITGVGRLDPSMIVDWGTNRNEKGDFNYRAMSQFGIHPGGHPILLVVKKNVSVLDGLLQWIKLTANASVDGQKVFKKMPLLVIDDEADNASIDTRAQNFASGVGDPAHKPTAINARIRTILKRFEQASYVGYTATPFANIFIHPDAETGAQFQDLFPRDFIVNMPTPENYIGASRIFGVSPQTEDEFERRDEGLPSLVKAVADYAASSSRKETAGWMPPVHKKDHIPVVNGVEAVPDSLLEAIRCFALVVAARRQRGQGLEHNSMLIHVTRFKAVQNHVVQEVQDALDVLVNGVRYGGSEGLRDLKALWISEFEPVTRSLALPDCPPLNWSEVEEAVRATISTIRVREINGSSADVLDYDINREQGLNVIAIGGDKLARGLTLEGLSISYFLRGASMYDTLMQMGRWFGYRSGYLDLCRLFTTQDHLDWYGHIAQASEELRSEFDRMEFMKAEPVEFGFRVRSHPTLTVTSKAKMQHGTELQVSFAGDISETTVFSTAKSVLERNQRAVSDLLSRLDSPEIAYEADPSQPREGGRRHRWIGSHLWKSVPVSDILTFLNDFSTHEDAARANAPLLAKYIRQQNRRGELVHWNILLVGGDSVETTQLGPYSVKSVERQPKGGYGTDPDNLRFIGPDDRYVIRRLVNPRDEAVDLGSQDYDAAFRETLAAPPKRKRKTDEPPKYPGGTFLRGYRRPEIGLLLLYPLARSQLVEIDGREIDHTFLAGTIAPIGMGISFPTSGNAERVSYVVNSVYSDGGYDDDDGEGDA